MLVLESSGKIDNLGNGFASPIEDVLTKLGYDFKKISLEREIDDLLAIQNGVLNKKTPIIISGGFVDLSSKSRWYLESKKFISQAVENRNPILGICFGAQMIFSSLYPQAITLQNVGEIGEVKLVSSDNKKYILEGCEERKFYTYHFDGILYSDEHRNTIEPIALSTVNGLPIYQAFKLNNATIYGLQFHAEFNYDKYKRLLYLYKDDIEAKVRQKVTDIIDNISRHDAVISIFENFMKEVLQYEKE